MKTNRRELTLILTILTVLAVFTTFSCSGLFTSPDSKPGTGTLSINLPGSGARANSVQYSGYVTFYKITVFSKETGKVVVPTKKVNGSAISEQVPVGNNYSVIIQGINDGTTKPANATDNMDEFKYMYEHNIPLFLGRTDNVSIKEGETTPVSVHMVYPFVNGIYDLFRNDDTDNFSFSETSFDWGTGKFPTVIMNGKTCTGWAYEDENGKHTITELPDTSAFPGNLEIEALFDDGQGGGSYNFPPAGTPGVYYVTQDGSGNLSGTDPDNTASFHNVFVDMNNHFILEDCDEDGCPRIYILSDIANADLIKRKVKCIGVNISNGNGNITISGKCKNNTSEMSYTLVCNIGGIILENITINGEGARCGIDNRNILTLNHCRIINCAPDTSNGMPGPGINTSANLTLNACEITNCHNDNYNGGGITIQSVATVEIHNSSITNCSADCGGGIYNSGTLILDSNSTISDCTATGTYSIDGYEYKKGNSLSCNSGSTLNSCEINSNCYINYNLDSANITDDVAGWDWNYEA